MFAIVWTPQFWLVAPFVTSRFELFVDFPSIREHPLYPTKILLCEVWQKLALEKKVRKYSFFLKLSCGLPLC
jgi:hypothetical protein